MLIRSRFIQSTKPTLIKHFSTSTCFKATTENYYDILSIPHNADKARIKSQFYQLSMKFHPDKNPQDEQAHEKFLKITEAYSVLSDEIRRRDYDRNFINTNSKFSKNMVTNRFRSKPPPQKPVKLYPENVKYRQGFQQSFNGEKYDNQTHQGEHYDQFNQSSFGTSTPYRPRGRPVFNDLPKMEGAGDVMSRFFMLGTLLLVSFGVVSAMLSNDKENYKAGYKSRNK